MVYLFNNQVALAPTPQLDAFGRLRTSTPTTLFDSQQRWGLDNGFVSNVLNGGQVLYVPTQSSANLSVSTTSGSYAARESRFVFRYQPGKSQLAMMTFVMAPASSGNLRQQVGYYGEDNGYFLQLTDQLYICERSNVSGTVTHSNVAQSSWNGDPLNGSGASTISLDMTKSQIFFIDIEWLGVGSVRTGFVINGQYIVAHTFQHANIVPNAYITTATLPLRYEILNLTGGAPASNLTQICSTVISEAGYTEPLTLFSNLAPITSTLNTWVPVISVRLDPSRLDAIALIKQAEIALTSQQAGVIHWAVWASSNVSGVTFTSPPNNGSVVVAHGGTMNINSSYQIASGIIPLSQGNATISSTFEMSSYFAQIGRDSFTNTSDTTTLAVYAAAGAPTGWALLSWQELL